jgi:mersacidin/lichenicidin family type 2 lantibiotic
LGLVSLPIRTKYFQPTKENTISYQEIIRAWKDEEHRLSLSVVLPEHPAGLIALADAELDDDAAGGLPRITNIRPVRTFIVSLPRVRTSVPSSIGNGSPHLSYMTGARRFTQRDRELGTFRAGEEDLPQSEYCRHRAWAALITVLVIAGCAVGSACFISGSPGDSSDGYIEGVGEQQDLMPTANHVPEGQSVEYSTTPPTSGDH